MINNNRQAGRRRGRGGQQQRPQGNGPRDNGNRIDNRSRGNAAQLLEKYKSLARDAQQAGDRVNTEYYLQFADHYFRVLAETRSRFEENRTPMQGGANTFQDDEQDYNDEGEPVARTEQPRQHEGQRAEQNRDGQEPRRDRQDGNRDGNRQDGNRDRDGNRQDVRQNNGGQQGYPGERQVEGSRGTQNSDRQDRQGGERSYNEDRPRRESNDSAPDRYVRNDRGNRYQNEERTPVQQDDAPVEQAAVTEDAPRADEPQEAPRRRGRPRREPVADAAPAFEADRLPPALMASAIAPAEPAPANDTSDAEPEEKPRRRRGRPPASEATGV